mmetsp:Transcript_13329/g.32440  ORF Transcript_13329/g.32440 Transcript_13329/m.32440 type:complete len:220 (+) Transcript_13329:2269-2928(+)
MQYSAGSVSTTLNSTPRIPPRAKKVSPLRTGRYASRKYGLRYTSKRLPLTPSMVSPKGSTWMRCPYLTSVHWCTETTSPRRTRRFLRTTLFMRILPSSQCSSASTMHTVSFRFLPLISTVSPRNSWSSSILARFSATTLLSSFTASSTTSRLGDFLRTRIAVDTSFSFFTGGTSAAAAAGVSAILLCSLQLCLAVCTACAGRVWASVVYWEVEEDQKQT